MVELGCETGACARSEVFQDLGRELCLQVVATPGYPEPDELGQRPNARGEGTIQQLVDIASELTGEPLVIRRLVRWERAAWHGSCKRTTP